MLEATVEIVRAEGRTAKLARSILVVRNTSHPSLQEGQAFDHDALAPATSRAYEEVTAALTEWL